MLECEGIMWDRTQEVNESEQLSEPHMLLADELGGQGSPANLSEGLRKAV